MQGRPGGRVVGQHRSGEHERAGHRRHDAVERGPERVDGQVRPRARDRVVHLPRRLTGRPLTVDDHHRAVVQRRRTAQVGPLGSRRRDRPGVLGGVVGEQPVVVHQVHRVAGDRAGGAPGHRVGRLGDRPPGLGPRVVRRAVGSALGRPGTRGVRRAEAVDVAAQHDRLAAGPRGDRAEPGRERRRRHRRPRAGRRLRRRSWSAGRRTPTAAAPPVAAPPRHASVRPPCIEPPSGSDGGQRTVRHRYRTAPGR